MSHLLVLSWWFLFEWINLQVSEFHAYTSLKIIYIWCSWWWLLSPYQVFLTYPFILYFSFPDYNATEEQGVSRVRCSFLFGRPPWWVAIYGYFVFVDVLYIYLLFKKCFYFEVFKLLDIVFLRFWMRIFTVLRTQFSYTKYNLFDVLLSTVTSEKMCVVYIDYLENVAVHIHGG